MAFLVANGAKPHIIPIGYFKEGSDIPNRLASYVIQQTKVSWASVSDNSQLKSKCFNKRMCAVVLNYEGKLSEGNKAILDTLTLRFRGVQFVVVDTKKYFFSLEPSLPPLTELGPLEPRIILLKRTPSKEFALQAKAHRGGFSVDSVSSFLTPLVAFSESNERKEPEQQMSVLKMIPKVIHRESTKKPSPSTSQSSQTTSSSSSSSSSTRDSTKTSGSKPITSSEKQTPPPSREEKRNPTSSSPHPEKPKDYDPLFNTGERREADDEIEEMVIDLDDIEQYNGDDSF